MSGEEAYKSICRTYLFAVSFVILYAPGNTEIVVRPRHGMEQAWV